MQELKSGKAEEEPDTLDEVSKNYRYEGRKENREVRQNERIPFN